MVPSPTATSVVAISRVRRVKRLRIQGKAANMVQRMKKKPLVSPTYVPALDSILLCQKCKPAPRETLPTLHCRYLALSPTNSSVQPTNTPRLHEAAPANRVLVT